jgi:hypothetical protein
VKASFTSSHSVLAKNHTYSENIWNSNFSAPESEPNLLKHENRFSFWICDMLNRFWRNMVHVLWVYTKNWYACLILICVRYNPYCTWSSHWTSSFFSTVTHCINNWHIVQNAILTMIWNFYLNNFSCAKYLKNIGKNNLWFCMSN